MALFRTCTSVSSFVQVLNSDGAVVASSANVAGLPPIAVGFVPADGRRELRRFDGLPIDDDPFRVLAQRIETSEGAVTLYVGSSLDPVQESVLALRQIFLVGVPIMALAVASVTWFFVGRALAPVEAMRVEVADIGGVELHRRVPEPAVDDEVARLARTMNAMLGRLEDAQRRQHRFVADASHELRSPLTNIRAQLEVDLARPDEADPLETERSVLEETVRLEELVDDLLQSARADERVPARSEPVDLDDVVFREAERIRTREAITVDASGVSGAQLLGDRDQLTRAVRNLLENAARYARERVSLTLTEDEALGEITFSVADDGPGVPAEARERIFERFARLDESRARGAGGTGLGLAITRDIVTRHGGKISVDAAYTDGARLVLRLPVEGPATVR
jgi:signal transduction histidine kinase